MIRVVIIGAGLAGLSAAYHLEQSDGVECVVLEREARIGGLLRTEVVDGFSFDYTGHYLHLRVPQIRELVFDLLNGQLKLHERVSEIFSHGVYTPYPFQQNLYGLPPDVVVECLMGLIEAHYNGAEASTALDDVFNTWVLRNFGPGIAKHFMFPYNEKLHTVPPDELTVEWMGRFVPGTSVEQALRGAVSAPARRVGYNAMFYYPAMPGIEPLVHGFAQHVKDFQLNREVVRVDVRNQAILLQENSSLEYDVLVSTLPLPELVQRTDGLPATAYECYPLLRHTSVLNINFGIEGSISRPDTHWVYFPESDFMFYRAGFPSNLSPCMAPAGYSSIYTEVAYSPWKPLGESGEAITRRVWADLVKTGLVREQQRVVVTKVLDIPYAYVIYDSNWRPATTVLHEQLEQFGIYSIGRYGRWEYSSMEDAIMQGRDVALRIAEDS